jgi:hypothetical protein
VGHGRQVCLSHEDLACSLQTRASQQTRNRTPPNSPGTSASACADSIPLCYKIQTRRAPGSPKRTRNLDDLAAVNSCDGAGMTRSLRIGTPIRRQPNPLKLVGGASLNRPRVGMPSTASIGQDDFGDELSIVLCKKVVAAHLAHHPWRGLDAWLREIVSVHWSTTWAN